MAAFSVVELMFVLGVAATLASLAVPAVRAGLDDMRAVAASRHVVARLQQARGRAVMRGRATALRFTPSGTGYVVSMYEDGNGNGVLAADIATGVDALVMPSEKLTEQMPGTDFGALLALPGAEGSTARVIGWRDVRGLRHGDLRESVSARPWRRAVRGAHLR